jgi:hypothetical protein
LIINRCNQNYENIPAGLSAYEKEIKKGLKSVRAIINCQVILYLIISGKLKNLIVPHSSVKWILSLQKVQNFRSRKQNDIYR